MRKINKVWLSVWLYVITLVSGAVIGALIVKWQDWSMQTKIFAFATALLPLHVLEEWRFPGGFHYMYNVMAKSDAPDRYPMNQMSDMWTNFIGVIFGVVILAVGVKPIFLVMQLFLCVAEILGHTKGGVFSYKTFKAKGKKTIYNPGLFTTVFGYLPVAVALIISFVLEISPLWWEWIVGVACGMVLGGLSLNLPEKLTKNKETPYAYDWGDGYFAKFTKEEDEIA